MSSGYFLKWIGMLAEACANVRNDLLTVVALDVWTCSVVIDLFSDFMLICRGNERQRSDVEGEKVTPALKPYKLGVYIRILGWASPVLFFPPLLSPTGNGSYSARLPCLSCT